MRLSQNDNRPNVVEYCYMHFYILFLVAVEGTTYTYISGVDRQNVLLLCDPMDGSSLELMWHSTLTNPVNIYSEISQFETKPTIFVCTRDATTIVTTYISLIGELQLHHI